MCTIQIHMDDKGNVTAEGPLDQRLLCYGMLEVAHDIVRDLAKPAERTSVLQTASVLDMAALSGRKS